MAEPVIRLYIRGEPIPQPRPRVVTIGGRARAISAPSKHPVTDWKKRIMVALATQFDGDILDGPVRLDVTFLMPRPKRLMRRKDPEGEVWHTTRPDADNLVKALKDACSGVIYKDDSQVCELIVRKKHHAKGGHPAAMVEVGCLSD
tara:strand:+ start:85 stop:522 length:438 start_codon:yes stop_codon:yes gene_type:complete